MVDHISDDSSEEIMIGVDEILLDGLWPVLTKISSLMILGGVVVKFLKIVKLLVH